MVDLLTHDCRSGLPSRPPPPALAVRACPAGADHAVAGTRVRLSIHLGQCFIAAAAELFTWPAGWLYGGFLGWLVEDNLANIRSCRRPEPGYGELRAFGRLQR